MSTLTNQPQAEGCLRVDWMWSTSVERVLDNPPDLFAWANGPSAD